MSDTLQQQLGTVCACVGSVREDFGAWGRPEGQGGGMQAALRQQLGTVVQVRALCVRGGIGVWGTRVGRIKDMLYVHV